MSEIEQKLVELIDKFENLSAELAPEVVEVGLTAARIAAGQELVYGVLALVVAGVFLWFPFKVWAGLYDADDTPDDIAFVVFTTGASSLPTLIATIIALANLLNIWNWAGLFDPRLWIAARVMGL